MIRRIVTRSTKQTFFFCHMKSCPAVRKFTNKSSPLSSSTAATKKLSLWPWETLLRLRRPFSRFTNAALWLGLRRWRSTLGASSWEAWPKKRKTTKQPSTVSALIFTETKLLWSVKFQPSLFINQYAVEMLLCAGQWSTAEVKRFPSTVEALNNEVTHLTGKKPAVTIKEKSVSAKPCTPYS